MFHGHDPLFWLVLGIGLLAGFSLVIWAVRARAFFGSARKNQDEGRAAALRGLPLAIVVSEFPGSVEPGPITFALTRAFEKAGANLARMEVGGSTIQQIYWGSSDGVPENVFLLAAERLSFSAVEPLEVSFLFRSPEAEVEEEFGGGYDSIRDAVEDAVREVADILIDYRLRDPMKGLPPAA